MSSPNPSRPPPSGSPQASAIAAPRRGPREVESELAEAPAGQQALLLRLSQEVAALRAALDVSRHRIAALEAEASEDPVSGLANQRAFEREVEKASAFCSRYQTASAVALIAVDGLGEIADLHGQAVANRLLRTLAGRLRAAVRSCDKAARIEPYRFGIVFWNADARDCEQRLQPIRLALSGIAALGEGHGVRLGLRMASTPIEGADAAATILARVEPMIADLRR